jgi:signal peptidase II
VPFHTSWPDDGFFRFTHVGNTGSAFGLFGDQNLVLIGASLLGLGVLYYFYRVHPNPSLLVRLSLGLMLAGALGNLTDRLIHGHVTDFIDIGPWWIFNLADSSIVVGLIVLAITMLFGQAPAVDEAGESDEPDERDQQTPLADAAEPPPQPTGEDDDIPSPR